MKEKPKTGKPSNAPEPRHVLGKIPAGDFDTELSPSPPSAKGSEPKPESAPEHVEGLGGLRKGTGATTPSPKVPFPEPEEDLLPDDAIVAMRRSGGFRFTSKRIVVFRDGRVIVEDHTKPGKSKQSQPRKLSDKELAVLYRALEKADLHELAGKTGLQPPDAYSYEIATRLGQETYSVELFDGSIPERVAPLIQLLSKYMRTQGRA